MAQSTFCHGPTVQPSPYCLAMVTSQCIEQAGLPVHAHHSMRGAPPVCAASLTTTVPVQCHDSASTGYWLGNWTRYLRPIRQPHAHLGQETSSGTVKTGATAAHLAESRLIGRAQCDGPRGASQGCQQLIALTLEPLQHIIMGSLQGKK
jgi:hypothetical protein